MTRRLTNQDAFDGAMLNLLNQGHSCVSASGRTRYRGPRGKSAIGALIPDELYATSMEGKNVHHWLAAPGSEYDALRERLGGVTPALLNELQDLHDRIGACMPSLYRHLAVDGAQRIARSFKLSMGLVHRCAAYQHLRGPRIFTAAEAREIAAAAAARALEAARAAEVARAAALAAVPAPDLAVAPMPAVAAAPTPDLAVAATPGVAATPTPDLAVAATPGVAAASTPDLAVAPALAVAAAPVPDLAVAPTATVAATPAPAPAPASEPMRVAESPQNDLDLIARGIARAIAAARPRSA